MLSSLSHLNVSLVGASQPFSSVPALDLFSELKGFSSIGFFLFLFLVVVRSHSCLP